MPVVYLGIGSNLGDRPKHIQTAVTELETNGIKVQKQSTIIETDPVGGPTQGKFLNAVFQTVTEHSPETLLTCLKNIEIKMGRRQMIRNGPRIIDIDILLYNNKHIDTPNLTIPHPRMLERDFVMIPLKEIAPEITKKLRHENH